MAGTSYPSSPRYRIEFLSDPYPIAQAGPCFGPDCPFDCLIIIGEAFWSVPPDFQQFTMLHEFGHCLGLDHDAGGVMSGEWAVTPENLRQKESLWPTRRYSYGLPFISADGQ